MTGPTAPVPPRAAVSGPASAARPGSRQRGTRRRWGRIAAGVAFLVLAVMAFAVGVAAATWVPLVEDARRTRDELQAISDRVGTVGVDVDAATIASLRADLAVASADVDRLAAVARDDPLVGLARVIPPLRDQVDGARAILDAARLTIRAAGGALDLGDRFVGIRDGSVPASSGGASAGSRIAQVVELMATSGPTVDAIAADLDAAKVAVDGAPPDLWGPLSDARDVLVSRLDTVVPSVDRLRDAAGILPGVLGWDAPVRYLVLDQSPPELRPTGGYVGSVGIVGFDRGELSGMEFHDIYDIDDLNDFPCVTPPPALAGHLLGSSCWELADANWSPDFPTSARDALRLYANETGDADVDGVIGLTTYAIDELLSVTGPVTVPGTDVTISSGETTWKALENTREPASSGAGRKAFLGVFAGALIARVLDLPASKWPELADAMGRIARERDAAAWFADADAQALAVESGFDGSVRQDAYDYLAVVDANVAPVSKLDYVTDRTLTDAVTIDAYGNATHDLEIAWDNRVDDPENAAYRALSGIGGSILGHYTRVLAPLRSRVESVSGGGAAGLTVPEAQGEEAGRAWWANYVRIPPGRTTLDYRWTAPYAADFDGHDGIYALTIQKQPGRLADTLDLTITAPPGATIVEATGGLEVNGGTATLRAALTEDAVVAIRYVMAP